MIEFEQPLVPFPDLDGYVHGIVSVDPPAVQCDGCGLVARGEAMAVTVILSGIQFTRESGFQERLCTDCRGAA